MKLQGNKKQYNSEHKNERDYPMEPGEEIIPRKVGSEKPIKFGESVNWAEEK